MAGEKKPPPVQLSLRVFGFRNHCSFSVKATQGGRPVSGQRVGLHFAVSSSDQVPVRRHVDAHGRQLIKPTGDDGIAYFDDQDLTSLEDFLTAVQAISQDAESRFVSLPSESSLPGVTFGKKIKRLEVTCEETSRSGYIMLTVKTRDDKGNFVDDVVSVGLDVGFELKDAASGTVLHDPANVSIPKSGRQLKVTPRGYAATCTVIQPSSDTVIVKKWQYQF